MPDYVTIKLYAETRKAIRLIAAETGEQMVQVMDRLCQEELKRVKLGNQTIHKSITKSGDEGEQQTKKEAP